MYMNMYVDVYVCTSHARVRAHTHTHLIHDCRVSISSRGPCCHCNILHGRRDVIVHRRRHVGSYRGAGVVLRNLRCGWSNKGFPGVGLQVEPCMDGKRWKRVKRERWKGNSEDRELGQSEGGRESGERENKEGLVNCMQAVGYEGSVKCHCETIRPSWSDCLITDK